MLDPGPNASWVKTTTHVVGAGMGNYLFDAVVGARGFDEQTRWPSRAFPQGLARAASTQKEVESIGTNR